MRKVYAPSYGEGVKALSYATFRKLHEKIEYFLYITEDQWEAEYEKATGKKVKKNETKGGE